MTGDWIKDTAWSHYRATTTVTNQPGWSRPAGPADM